MEDIRIPMTMSYDPLKDDLNSSIAYDFEETMNRSCFDANTMYNSGNTMTNVFTSLEAVSTREVGNQQPSKLGECAFEVPDDDFFENFDQLLINDQQLKEEIDAGAPCAKSREKDTALESTNKGFNKPQAKYTARVDVVNKGILRMVKTFYQDLLFEHFPEYKSKRLCRVNKERLLGDVLALLKAFPNKSAENDKLGEYVFAALRPNDVSFINKDVNFQKDVKVYFDCISKYSHKRLREVFKTNFGKIIFELIVSKPGIFGKLLDSNPLVQKNRKAYEEGLERFKKGFNLA